MTGKRPLRFCMVTTFYPPHSFGGDAIFVEHLARALVAAGHSVDIVHNVDAHRALGGRPGPPPAAVDGLTVHPLRSGIGLLAPLLTHQLGRPVGFDRRIRELLARPFDVVHFHNMSLMGAPAVLSYGRGVKLYTTHEAWLVCPTHTLFRFDRAPCERRHCVACTLVHRRPPQWWRFSRRLERGLTAVDAVISPSRSNIEIHRARGAHLPFVQIPNFVPETSAEGGEPTPPAPGQRPYFLYVGRLERLKGPQTLLPVFARFPAADLLVAGTGGLERRMRRDAASGNVRFLGHLPAAQLRQLYRNAIAVIVPSLCYEVFPLVVLEALRDGTPVLARNRGALREIVLASGGGALWNDDDELLGQLDRLLADREERDRLGRDGRAHARRHWSMAAHLERYLALVERIRTAQGSRR